MDLTSCSSSCSSSVSSSCVLSSILLQTSGTQDFAEDSDKDPGSDGSSDEDIREAKRLMVERSRGIRKEMEESRKLAESERSLVVETNRLSSIASSVDLEELMIDADSENAFAASGFRFFMCGEEDGFVFRGERDIVDKMNTFLFQCNTHESRETTYYMLVWREDPLGEVTAWEPKNPNSLTQLFESYEITTDPSGLVSNKIMPRLLSAKEEKQWKKTPLFSFWRKNRRKRLIDQKFFNPKKPSGFYSTGVGPGARSYFNTWSGMAFNPETNSAWVKVHPNSPKILERIKYHLFTILARSNRSVYRYLKMWLAYGVQKPGAQIQVVLVISGPQGAGKSVFFSNYIKLFGKHSVLLIKPKDLFARFGGTLLDDMVMVEVDEIDMSDARKADDLKGMIGADSRRREAKFGPMAHKRNWVNYIFTTNKRFCLPLESGHNRRFFHVHADGSKVGDKAYGQSLDEMFNLNQREGLRVLYHWLSNVNLKPRALDAEGNKTDVRTPWDSTPPVTEELRSQIAYNASEVEGWWLDVLSRGYHVMTPQGSGTFDEHNSGWLLYPVEVDQLFRLYQMEVKTEKISLKLKFVEQFRLLVPETTYKWKQSDTLIHMPPLVKCKKFMNLKFPGFFIDETTVGSKRKLEEYSESRKQSRTQEDKDEKKKLKLMGKPKGIFLPKHIDRKIKRIPHYFQITPRDDK